MSLNLLTPSPQCVITNDLSRDQLICLIKPLDVTWYANEKLHLCEFEMNDQYVR